MRFKEHLPDLSHLIILLPNALHVENLRRHFVKQAQAYGHRALMPPVVSTPESLSKARTRQSLTTPVERHFLLSSVLTDHPGLFPGVNRWQLGAELLKLFDELSLHEKIENAALLNDDARLLLDIYKSWCAAVDGEGNDSARLYRNQLLDNQLTASGEHVFLCGFDGLTPLEEAWADQLSAQGRLTRIEHTFTAHAVDGDSTADGNDNDNNTPNGTDYSDRDYIRALDLCAQNKPLSRRITRLKKINNPLSSRVRLFVPDNLEKHALGIAATVRHWLQDDIEDIAIVTQDRRLARRLRAILDDLNIALYDRSGWALSTTSGATAVHHLLADDEPHRQFLKLLRTPFVRLNKKGSAMIAHAERLLMHAERPPATWSALESLLSSSDSSSSGTQSLLAATRKIRAAVKPLHNLRKYGGGTENTYEDYFAALNETMVSLGMDERLWADAAGERVMEILGELRQIAQRHRASGPWTMWRDWLGYTLENNNFIVPHTQHRVSLLNLHQAQLAQPQGLILAAVDLQHNSVGRSPLVTELTAAELGLDSRTALLHKQRARYYKLLASSQNALLTYENNSNENTRPQAWVEELCHLCHAAWNKDLQASDSQDPDLNGHIRIRTHPVTDTPDAPPSPPEPTGQGIIRRKLSASACNTAIRCPYQYFARYDLGIYAEGQLPDGVLDSTQFGKKVHRCMAALVHRTEDDKPPLLPGPFKAEWTEENRDAAVTLAKEIVAVEFEAVAGLSYINTYYAQQATHYMEAYIRRLIDDNTIPGNCRLLSEEQYSRKIEGLTLNGKIDLVICTEGGEAHIIDYKTGNLPSKKDINNGNDVQLACYALLEPEARHLTYMNDKKKVEVSEAKKIERLREQCALMLRTFKEDYERGVPLLASGHKSACQHCDYGGLCRKKVWGDGHA